MYPAEVCEARVLLTATGSDDYEYDQYTTDTMPSPDMGELSSYADMYDTSDYYAAAMNSPIGDELSVYDDQYDQYESYVESAEDQAYDSASSQSDDGYGGDNDTDGSGVDDLSEPNTDDSSPAAENANGTADDNASDDEGITSLLDDVFGGSTDTSADGTPFQFPTEVADSLEELTLPVQVFGENLFLVQPDGTESVENTTTTESTVTGDPVTNAETGESSSPTSDLQRELSLKQIYNGADDWEIHQSVTNRFDQSEVATTEDGEEGTSRRIGSETLSITIINGTTVVTTWSILETQTFGTGSFTDVEEEDEFEIPDDWLVASRTSVNQTNDQESEDRSGEEGQAPADAGSDNGSTPRRETLESLYRDPLAELSRASSS